ncbi:MAG TPA: hypothetical protein VJG32_21970 [Anaerolineae bacterium]|nr:hypothetical protein [Anaerolineae bacterium]
MSPEPVAALNETVSSNPLPPGYEDYAGEIQVVNGKPPRWATRVPYLGILLALAYYVLVRVSDPVNLVFAALFIAWMIYTPIAQKRGWFFIPM